MFLYRYWTKMKYYDSDPEARVMLDELVVQSETPAGYWYHKTNGKRSWVSKSRKGNKSGRYCYANKSDAWYSYKVRVNKRISYLKRDLKIVEAAKVLMELGRKRALKGQHLTQVTAIKNNLFDISMLGKITIRGTK